MAVFLIHLPNIRQVGLMHLGQQSGIQASRQFCPFNVGILRVQTTQPQQIAITLTLNVGGPIQGGIVAFSQRHHEPTSPFRENYIGIKQPMFGHLGLAENNAHEVPASLAALHVKNKRARLVSLLDKLIAGLLGEHGEIAH